MPSITVWFVSSSREEWKEGSSAASFCKPVPIFSRSPLVLGSIAILITGSGKSMRSRMTGASCAVKESPVVVSFKPATATMSPATALSTSSRLSACISSRRPTRSFFPFTVFCTYEPLSSTRRVDAHESEGAYEGVRHDLERQARKGFVVAGVAHDLLLGVLHVDAAHGGQVEGRGEVAHDGVEHGLHALVLEGGAAGHGHEVSRNGAFAEELDELLLRGLLPLKVLLHGLLVLLHSLLDHGLAVLGGLLLQVGGDVHNVEGGAHLLAVPDDRLVGHEVHDPGEILLGADGELDGHGVGTEVLND